MRTAVITIVAGRDDHLRRQCSGLAGLSNPPDVHVVVAMRPSETASLRTICGPTARVVALSGRADPLPLARARNAGARRALSEGAELLTFLDVDCIPSAGLLERYRAADAETRPALLCGPVAYLPARLPASYCSADLPRLGRAHPARPIPAEDDLLRHGDHRLFWSLSFAIHADAWRAIGGFCERYTGYGAEDTDFAQLARREGVELCWVGGAWAYHQHHSSVTPPVDHLDEILGNATIFYERWGWWPMRGWLEEFAHLGLARFDTRRQRWRRTVTAATTRESPLGSAGASGGRSRGRCRSTHR